MISLLLFSSCFKEEDARPTFTSYETIGIGNEYYDQIFYSLSETKIVSSNNYLDWNLGFYCNNDKSYIRLNSAANMWAYKTNSTNFYENFSVNYTEEEKRFDGSHGLDDDLAIDEILGVNNASTDTIYSSGEVYIIHPGIKANGTEIGDYKKFILIGVYDDAYIVKYANLDGTDEQTVSIPKNPSLNFVAYSWYTNTIVDVEPDKTTWDLLFSRFTDTVYTTDGSEYLLGYAVTGTYLNQNSNGVKAYAVNDISYSDITEQDVDLSRLSSNLNVIGHTWKVFSSQYTIDNTKSYIVQDRNGNIYKLHFLSFYDPETGQKGYPSFEFELL